jgi:hypothetical protein
MTKEDWPDHAEKESMLRSFVMEPQKPEGVLCDPREDQKGSQPPARIASGLQIN